MTVRGELVDYPARIIVPFLVGPVPLYYAFGAAVEMNANLGLQQAVKASGTFTYKGDIGIEGTGLRVPSRPRPASRSSAAASSPR